MSRVTHQPTISTFIAVEYDEYWWLAYVTDSSHALSEVSFNFLHSHGPSPSYIYPQVLDHLVIDASDVLLHLNSVTTNGRTYSLGKEETIAATVALKSKRNIDFDTKN